MGSDDDENNIWGKRMRSDFPEPPGIPWNIVDSDSDDLVQKPTVQRKKAKGRKKTKANKDSVSSFIIKCS